MIKAILWDFDGVLMQSDLFSEQFSLKYNVKIVELLDFFDGPFKECMVGKKDLKLVLSKYLKKWGWSKTVDEFIEYRFESEKNINNRLLDKIKELKKNNILNFLGSNQEKYRTKYIRYSLGFNKILDKIYVSNELGYRKPDIFFYEIILNDLIDNYGIKYDELLIVDDNIKNIEIAKKLNIKGVVYKNFEDFEKDLNNYLLDE